MFRRALKISRISPMSQRFSSSKYLMQTQMMKDTFSGKGVEMKSINMSELGLDHLPDTEGLINNVPQLAYGLNKHLNGELVFGDQGVGNLPKKQEGTNDLLQKISNFVEPSKDQALIQKGQQFGCKYISSTSSVSSPLIALYYLLTSFREPQLDNIFDGMPFKPERWMISFRKPTTFYLKKVSPNIQAIVSDKGMMPAMNEVLMDLGHIVQYFLTHQKKETDALMRGEQFKKQQNYYHYAKVNNQIMLRSQIDCMSYDAQGKPFVFQIKSRACAPIRYDVQNYKQYKDYEITSKRGQFESFQRQYFDLIRGGFLKYVMQVKIGKMDGAFIAYHNTQKIYGYEYVKLKQMALRVAGDQYNLDLSFICTSKMFTIVLKHVRDSLPQHKDDDLKIGFYADNKTRRLIVMVQAMSILKQYKQLKQKKDGVQTIIDYFQKQQPLVNPVYKLHFDFYMFLNGIRLQNPNVLMTPHDTLEIKYHAEQPKIANKSDYIAFLYEAYKEEEVYMSFMYKGLWEYSERSSESEAAEK